MGKIEDLAKRIPDTKPPLGTEIEMIGERRHPAGTERHPARGSSATYKITSTGVLGEMRAKDDERRKRRQLMKKGLRAAHHSPFQNPAKKHGNASNWKATAPIRNIGWCKLPLTASRKEQAGVHRQMRGLIQGDRRERLLAGTARRERNRVSRNVTALVERVGRTDRNLCYNHQARLRLRLNFRHSSF